MSTESVQAVLPYAFVTVTPVDDPGSPPDTFVFDATASTGAGLRYDWSFGDGAQSDQPKVTHTYEFGTGTYPVRLLITDLHGITDLWTHEIVIGTGKNKPPVAYFTPSARYLALNEPLTVDARTSYDPDGDPIVYHWDFNFRMDTEEYYHFREYKRAGGVTDDDEEEGSMVSGGDKSSEGVTDNAAAGLVERLQEALERIPGTHKHAPDTGREPPRSLFDGRRSTNEPVFTLQEGFPDATRFYVKLRAVDIKGASMRIISEEVWPVEVVASKAPSHYMGEESGTFTFGASSTVTSNLPDEDLPIETEMQWSFEIPDPIADLGRNETGQPRHSMWINVTWSQNTLYEALGQLPNRIDLEVRPPEGDPIRIDDAQTGITLGLTGADGYGTGTWQVRLYARQGVDIDYTVSHFALVEQNPFRELEERFL